MFAKHLYGENVFVLDDTHSKNIISKISNETITQPLLSLYLKKAYRSLFKEIANTCFPKSEITFQTRMEASITETLYNKEQKFAVCSLARAGLIPSELFYQELHYFFNQEGIRQDHLYVSRKTNDLNEVVGVDMTGSKIGGDLEDRIILLPDPMGATGSSICHAIDHYKNDVDGTPVKIICAHLIITPEYIQKLKKTHPEALIFTLRIDRGLSSQKALDSTPGQYPKEEKGLNEHQYIIPGAGGVGELLTNSFV